MQLVLLWNGRRGDDAPELAAGLREVFTRFTVCFVSMPPSQKICLGGQGGGGIFINRVHLRYTLFRAQPCSKKKQMKSLSDGNLCSLCGFVLIF